MFPQIGKAKDKKILSVLFCWLSVLFSPSQFNPVDCNIFNCKDFILNCRSLTSNMK